MKYRRNKNTLVYKKSSTGNGYFIMELCPKPSLSLAKIVWKADKGRKKSLILREWEGLLMLDGLSKAVVEKQF